ncbi:2-hydroxyacyl-CoA dehydratase subunit D [Intestinimonas butyriciproducens]|uniref:2-hydroxyacyl-CoA dehydratase subunit D n=1 Tax=Intestinimonas butyriciproducens TaxID=1297617 RepID=UPI00195CB869|nr:2-hydroxyacyl-CoA dehydratase family protein [Intestinimonas butyriciproducens]MBM6975407.1 2-hydroxyacyl-CoA dehydratase [Intestinimonas butyriciproducens]
MEENVKALLEQFKAIAGDPKKAVADHLAETGKGAIGMMPIYAPEELVHATGFLPVGLWGGSRPVTKARAYLPPFACSVMQQVMELECEGAYDDLAAVVFSVPCDTLKCMSQKWKGTSPVLVFTHPQNRGLEAANRFLEREYAILKEKLENVTGVKITNAALEHSIQVYNENRAVMREFSVLAAQYPQVISAVDRHAVFKSRLFIEKSRHTALVKQLMEAVRAAEPQPWTGKKVVVTGILLEPNGLLELFDQLGLAIVADDLAQESRQIRVDVPEGDEAPLYRLARVWQKMYGCSVATDIQKQRGPMLLDMVRKTGADAIVVAMMKFCDPEEWDYPIYYKQFEAQGVHNLMIEVDQESTSFEQIHTRLQSLVETL